MSDSLAFILILACSAAIAAVSFMGISNGSFPAGIRLLFLGFLTVQYLTVRAAWRLVRKRY
jgi:hypothetical protein